MKTTLLTLLFAIVASVGTMFAETGTCGENLTWDLSDGVLTISGTGAMANYASGSDVPWYNNRESITSVSIADDVTSIGKYAFYRCNNLTSISIGNNVTSIGSSAFNNCTGLTSVTIPNSVTSISEYAFLYCPNIASFNVASDNLHFCSEGGVLFSKDMKTLVRYPEGKQEISYNIPHGVTTIGNRSMTSCVNLTSVVIPNSVTTIEEFAFYGSSNLVSITIPLGVTSIGESAFGYSSLTSITIPETVTFIGTYIVGNCCNSLTEIVCKAIIPPIIGSIHYDTSILVYVPAESVEAYRAADGWKKFTNILPICPIASGTCGAQGDNLTWELSCDSVLTISGEGEMADWGNSNAPWYSYKSQIKFIVITDGVTNIRNSAFSQCNNLTSITIGNSVSNIGEYNPFAYCQNLSSIVVSSGNTTFDSRNGCNAIIEKSTNSLRVGSNSTIIPNDVINIGKGAFCGCESLTNIEIPNNVTSISEWAFYRCKGLTNVDVPNSVISIGDHAFRECYLNLTSVAIGDGVTSIGNNAFEWCFDMTSISIGSNVTSIGSGTFFNDTSLTIISTYAVEPPICGSDAFYNVDKSIPLYVPCASIDAYKVAEGWKEFTNILPISDCLTTVVIGDGEHVDLCTLGYSSVQKVIVETGGQVTSHSSCVHVDSLIVQTNGNNSGQVHHNGAGINADHVFLEYTLNPCGTTASPQRWYAFSVPFEVDINTGISRTCDDKTLVSGTDFLVMEYNGLLRAALGKGWSKKQTGTLEPGHFYMLGIEGTCNNWRFEKTGANNEGASTDLPLTAYGAGESDNLNIGWNGLGNTLLHYSALTIQGLSSLQYMVLYNNCLGKWETRLISEINLFVGQPFFIQTELDALFDFHYNAPSLLPALRAPKAATPLMHFTLSDAESTDHLYLTLHDDATDTYTIGRDVARMSTDCKTAAQLWCVSQEGTQLTAHGIAEPQTETVVPLGLFAPTAGEYLLELASYTTDEYQVALLYHGTYVGTLDEGQVLTLNLNAGNNSGYSLSLARKVPTDLDSVQSEDVQSTKQIIDGHLFILRGEHIYDAQGKLAK